MPYDSQTRRTILTVTLVATLILCGIMVFPFVRALLWALVFTILTRPIHLWYRHRLRSLPTNIRSNGAAALTVITTAFIFAIPGIILTLVLISQIDTWIQKDSLGTFTDSLNNALQSLGSGQLAAFLAENREELNRSLRSIIMRSGSSVANGSIQMIFALLTQFFLLRDSASFRAAFINFAPLSDQMCKLFLGRIAETTRAVFAGTVIVGLTQGGITYALLVATGVPYSALLGAFATLCAIVPLVGAPIVYIPVGIWLISEGRINAALWVLLGGFLVVSQVDNILKPLLIGNRTGLHPIAVFFAILGGLGLFGPVGVMAGPMLLTAILVLLRAWQDSPDTLALSIPK